MKLLKDKLFIKGLVYDLTGMATVAIPLIGPFLDLLWAPYAAKKMREMYPGKKGKLASVIVFLEEILPGTDIIPTFTLMYLYSFVWKKQPQPQVIEVESY
ncbi:hypothetical protein [Christiangramia sabulilitoris]|uniref:DUF4112 domain-containing protein n=1 Tax=Christiangramia sabulilitoris TaxID=2583991 RepID=A0A550I715_9FLAO|nr:hypothetical protein [Christiangramia sabulilitoris]TRO66598.1 hypothetical protein FGM01_01565 [Christiangramia sabulilitoris]